MNAKKKIKAQMGISFSAIITFHTKIQRECQLNVSKILSKICVNIAAVICFYCFNLEGFFVKFKICQICPIT